MQSHRMHFAFLAFLTLALLATSSFAAGTPKKEEPEGGAENAYNAAVEKMKAGSWAEAADEFARAIEMQEDFAEAHSNLGFCLRKQGEEKYDAALEHYNRALQLNPKLAQTYHYRGILYALSGNEAAAKADHMALVELDRELADELMAVLVSGEEPEGHGGAIDW